MDPIIRTKNMDITYNLGKKNEFKATQDLTVDIYPGEIIAFFGPSGCGKSTIFYSVLGVLEPSAGELYVKGENPYSFSHHEMVAFQSKVIGIIYQSFYLIPSLSVIDNVALPQIFQGESVAKRRERSLNLLNRFGVGGRADSFPALLSGGQSQRVSICRSMVNDPDIILADEPTGNLDSISSKQVLDFLQKINEKDGKTIIMITHDAAQLNFAHRVFYINDGSLQRIVPNPGKEQVAKFDKQKMFVTEIDQLSTIFPYLSPPELKVKSMINYLTQDLDFTQIVRMEELSQEMLERRLNRDKFYEILKMPIDKGGVGIGFARAGKMADKIEKILKQANDVRRYRRRQDQGTFYKREDKLVQELYENVAGGKGKLSLGQKRRLKQAVRSRISGLYTPKEFYDQIRLAYDKKGVGLSKKMADDMSRYFEKVITQGVEVKSKFADYKV